MAIVGSAGIPSKAGPVKAAPKLYGVPKGSGMNNGVLSEVKPPSLKQVVPKTTGFLSPVSPITGGSKSINVNPPRITNQPVALTGTPAPSAGGAGGTPGSAGTPEPSPYDSTYYIDLANATANANDRIAGYQSNISQGATGLTGALAQYQANLVLADRNAQNAENARGGFAQGALGNTLGQLGTNSLNAQSAATLKYQQDAENWNNAIQSARQGLSRETIALGLASAARQKPDPTLAPGSPGSPGTPAPGATPVSEAKNPAQVRLSQLPPVKNANQVQLRQSPGGIPKASGLSTKKSSARVIQAPPKKGR